MDKARVKMNKWYILGGQLYGEPSGHPNKFLDNNLVRTSNIIVVETNNTIYELGEPKGFVKNQPTQQFIEDTSPK